METHATLGQNRGERHISWEFLARSKAAGE